MPQSLSERCEAILTGSGQAIDWVQGARRSVRRLDNEADSLIEKLRRSRNLCRRLGAAVGRPLSIGVFGMSQAGKSYLISTLARGANGQLETVLDGDRFNFIGHINPPGGGKEATGLVTRFTRRPSAAPKSYPVELTLFSEADVIKILGNSFFNDFDRERVTFNTEPEHIRQHLAAVEKQHQPQPTGGLDEDDMVDLLDYFDKRFAKSMEPLKADFWPAVINLAPRLPGAARGKLLSVLWGETEALTEAYVKLRAALDCLSQVRTVYVPLAALVTKTPNAYEWATDSILNVDVLDRLGRDEGDPLTVLPATGVGIGAETGIARSLLAMLTAEMKFVLADPPVAALLENVDLLDFPGYRGRLAIASLDEVGKQIKNAERVDPVAQLLLRGKVAYLFERYTDDQEMNILIMCTRCDQQIEITTLAPVLNTWVHSTQGETPTERGSHPPGLIWVITQLDRRLEPKPGQSETQQRQEWSNMVHITLLERFAQCDWLQEWADGRPFDNVFLVRKPGFLRSVIETEGENSERGLIAGEDRRLAQARAIFIENDTVSRHIRDAGSAWDAVLQLNDGGMERLSAYFEKVAHVETKLARIADQVRKITEDIVEHRLGTYFFAEGAGEVEKKKKIAQLMADTVEQHADSFGELLASLQPASEQLRQLYLRADTTSQAAAESGDAPATEGPVKRSSLVRLPLLRKGAVASDSKPVGGASRAFLFAKVVMSEWIKQLRELPGNLEMQRFLGLSAVTLLALTDELITGADRLHIEEQLIDVLTPLEEKRTTTRAGIVDQQVLLARGIVDDFVDQLGFASVPLTARPPSPVDGRKIFEPPAPVPAHTLPLLDAEELPYSGMFVLDWLDAFRSLALGNAGHSAGREITPAQNAALGEILAVIKGGAAVAAG